MPNPENLTPRDLSTDEATEMGRKGGIKSGEVRREKRKMSEMYGAFLMEKFSVTIDGSPQKMTGWQLVNRVTKAVLVKGGAPAVSLMKEIREATEGGKLALTGPNGGPIEFSDMTDEELDARLKAMKAAE
jgi:hypothetical protein